jgi:DNA gyrase/topoisomerase IV subunit A
MNKTQAEQIMETAVENGITALVSHPFEEFEIVFEGPCHFTCQEAARHALNALLLEKLYKDKANIDFQKYDVFKPGDTGQLAVVAEGDDQKVLKIDNKAELLNFPVILVFTSAGNVCKVQNMNYGSIQSIIAKCEFESDEKPIYIVGTKSFSGFLIAGFESGKVAKITMKSFVTEFNRKKLKNAFNTESRLVFIEHINTEVDLVAVSNINKVVVFNTSQINAVESRTTKGVQVMKSKDRSLMAKMRRLDQVKLSDPSYYHNESLNVVGYYLKDGDEV